MRKVKIVFLSILVMACGTDKPEKKNEASVYNVNDWIPTIMKEGDSIKYFEIGVIGADTVYSGEVFKAKLYMPISEFYDSLGQNIILKEQKMSFEINGYNLYKFLTVRGDTGHIEIPIDSILNKITVDSTEWKASIMPTTDTTYIISGKWFFKKK